MHSTDAPGLLSPQQFKTIMEMQEQLNALYTGTEWRRVTQLGQFLMAMDAEWVEFADELQSDWKWYNKKATSDKDKAFFELVDVIHFMAASMLHRRSVEGLALLYPEGGVTDFYVGAANPPVGDPWLRLINIKSQFINSLALDNHYGAVQCFLQFVAEAAAYLEVNADAVLLGYKLKNQRNQERVAGGVMEGRYDKSKETPLEL